MSMGGRSSETGPSTDRRRLAGYTADHPGEVLLVVGAVAYALGYVNLRLVAAGLGVAPSDLGLDTNDYLMSAATWILLLSPFMVGYVVLPRFVRTVGWRSATGVSLVAGTAGVALVAVLLTAGSVSIGAAAAATLAILLAAGAGWWLAGPTGTVVITVAISVLIVALPNGHQWGERLSEHPDSSSAPIWLELVLSVEEGTAQLATGDGCTVRLLSACT